MALTNYFQLNERHPLTPVVLTDITYAEVSMNGTRLKLLAMSALLSLAGAVLGDGVPDKTLQEIAPYRQWTRATEKPIAVEIGLSAGGG